MIERHSSETLVSSRGIPRLKRFSSAARHPAAQRQPESDPSVRLAMSTPALETVNGTK